MNYSAVLTKIKAKNAKLLEKHDFEQNHAQILQREVIGDEISCIKSDFAQISTYLHEKPIRDFVGLWREYDLQDIWRKLGGLPQHDRRQLKNIIGTEIDLQNILYLYRLRQFYGIVGDAVFTHLTPICHKLSPAETKTLAEAKSIEDFSRLLENGVYSGVFGGNFCEQAVSRAMRKQYKKAMGNLPKICEYFYARRLEIQNIRAFHQGTQDGLSPAEILKNLH